MKHILYTLALLLYSITAFAQEESQLEAFIADSTWTKEIIEFPIGFAQDIPYEGYEDLRFAKQWRDQTHKDFWCYTFAWHIKTNEKQTTKTLETYMASYYNGLMAAVNKKKDFKVPATTVLFIENNSTQTDADFIGKISVYDAFNSEAMMTLNVLVKAHYCDATHTSAIVFRLSPQTFDQEIWIRFDTITLKSNICEY